MLFLGRLNPDGLAQTLIVCDKFIGNDSVCLALGDNIFCGTSLTKQSEECSQCVEKNGKATVFGYWYLILSVTVWLSLTAKATTFL